MLDSGLVRKLSICFITEDFYPEFIGGQGIYGYHLVGELGKIGHKVTVLAEKKAQRERFWQRFESIRMYFVPFCFGNQIILALLEYLYFKKYLLGEYFDIIHANQLSGLLFTIFKPQNVGKVIVSVHNTYYDMAQKTNSFWKLILYQPLIFLERMLYKRADGLLFNSPDERDELLSYYQIKDKSIKAVYLGMEFPRFSALEAKKARMEIRKKLHLSHDAEIVLYLGRLVKRKKVDSLIRALSMVKKDHIFGLIIGQGSEMEKLKSDASSNIFFLGFVPEPREYILAADLFVTVSEAEGGFLLAALEAASYGLPLILSPSAAGFPIIKEGVNGFIVKSDDVEGLADKIKRVILRLRSGQVGEESRKLARQFSWEKCARETVKFYHFLLIR